MTKARILIVEDEAIVAKSIENRLMRLGYTVPAIAFSGTEAIQKVAETRPDLVLMDIKLQGEMDGVQAAKEIRDRFDVPVVYLTAYADKTTLQQAKITDPFGYLLKPFGVRELSNVIEMAIYKHKLEKQLKESKARYRAISELISDYAYCFRVEPDGRLRCEWATEAFIRATGLDFDRVDVYDRWQRAVHPDDLAIARRRLQTLLSGQPDVSEYRVISQEGEVRWVRAHGHPVWDEARNRVVRIIGAIEDITARKQAEETLRQHNRELALFNRASQVFHSTLDLDQVLLHVLEQVHRQLANTACSIWLTDPETDELICRQVIDPQSDAVRGWRLAPGQGIAGWVARTGQSLITPDTRTDERHFKGVDKQTGVVRRSILTVPLRIKQKVTGVIQALDAEIDRFSTADLTLLLPMTASAAIAIENAQLYEQVRRHAAELEQRLDEHTNWASPFSQRDPKK